MLNAQLNFLESPGWLSSLAEPLSPYPEMASSLGARRVNISRAVRWRGAVVASKDVVFLNRERTYLVVVARCVEIDVSFGLLVRCCTRASGTETASCWHVDPEVTLYHLVDEPVMNAAFYRFQSSDNLEILH